MQEMWVRSLGQQDALEKEMAAQVSVPDWEIPRTEEPGRLWSTRLQRVRHDLVIKQHQQRKRNPPSGLNLQTLFQVPREVCWLGGHPGVQPPSQEDHVGHKMEPAT